MHGETDAFHMLRLHSMLVVNKDIALSELENMIPFQREAFLTILLESKEKVNKGSNPQFDINHEDIRDR
jgi:hypothetical protein